MTTDADVQQERGEKPYHFDVLEASARVVDDQFAPYYKLMGIESPPERRARREREAGQTFAQMLEHLVLGNVKLSERRVHWGTKQ